MPILMMALMALVVFIGIGLLLFSATIAESRTREHEKTAESEKARGMHA